MNVLSVSSAQPSYQAYLPAFNSNQSYTLKHDTGADTFRHNKSSNLANKMQFGMLVLSRKLNEKIVIGNNIVVTVVKIDRNQVKIGVQAPVDVPVYREEIAPGHGGAA